jgi:predicted Fe-S protein YdhL (DUF1289 family)
MEQPASPCINVCRMNPATGLCDGCLRTLDEIASWGSASTAQKENILQALPGRRQQPISQDWPT